MDSLDRILYQVTRPARYTGGEWNAVIRDWQSASLRIALAYPDIYEVGMSSLALPILYDALNRQPGILVERVFAPWTDMESAMREKAVPLFSLESRRPLQDFDVIGFSLSYELTYTNVLNMLDLAGIPVRSAERGDEYPLVIAGGGCCLNPEPMSPFIDLFVIGEAEDAVLRLVAVLREYKGHKRELLEEAAGLPGIYVPSFYEVAYFPDGTVRSVAPKNSRASVTVERQVVSPLPPPVTAPVVPYIETVHDHGPIEIQRGCSRGCRFCQATTIYRPVRERSHEEVIEAAGAIIRNCGYSELSLVSLSSGDYHDIGQLIRKLLDRYRDIRLSLPSLRLDASAIELVGLLPSKRKMTLTFAPEAGTERLRTVINKVIPESTILDTVAAASEKGGANIKLYFMVGLPTETDDDVRGIARLVEKICGLHRRHGGRPLRVRVSVATLVPKPHTACQWYGQETGETLSGRINLLRQELRRTGVQLSWHDPGVSQLEAALSRGDRRVGDVILEAWRSGRKFDAWREHFSYRGWVDAFARQGLGMEFFANRQRTDDEVFPWAHIDAGVTPGFLRRERERMSRAEETPDCRRDVCSVCGLQRWQEACREKLKGASGAADTCLSEGVKEGDSPFMQSSSLPAREGRKEGEPPCMS